MDTFKKIDWFKKHHPSVCLSVPIIFVILDFLNFEIGKEAYFYTLSTVAQSLAALIGIIGVFCIFRIDKLSDQRKYRLTLLFEKINDFSSYRDDLERKYKHKFDDLIDLDIIKNEEELSKKIIPILEEIKIDDIIDPFYKLKFKELNNLVYSIEEIEDKDKQIRRMFNKPLSFGLIAITISILILPFGWIEIPSVINISYIPLKMFYVGIIIYLALLSVLEIAFMLDEILGLELADRELEKKGIKGLLEWP